MADRFRFSSKCGLVKSSSGAYTHFTEEHDSLLIELCKKYDTCKDTYGQISFKVPYYECNEYYELSDGRIISVNDYEYERSMYIKNIKYITENNVYYNLYNDTYDGVHYGYKEAGVRRAWAMEAAGKLVRKSKLSIGSPVKKFMKLIRDTKRINITGRNTEWIKTLHDRVMRPKDIETMIADIKNHVDMMDGLVAMFITHD